MAEKKKLYTHKFRFNGKYYYVRSVSKQGLIDKVAKKKEELEQGLNTIQNPSLNELYNTFTQNRIAELKESTIRTQKHQYELIAAVQLGGMPFGEMLIRDIKRYHIENARLVLLKSGQKAQNLNNCFAHLNHVFNYAMLNEIIDKNPCKALPQLKRSEPPITETKHRALTIAETEKFFQEAERRNSYYLNLFEIMIKTGMRVGEVSALYLTDIDKEFIHIRRTITRDYTGGYVVGDDTKTVKGKRDIPLTAEVSNIIKKQKLLNNAVFGLSWSGLLFKSVEGNILREYQVNREIKRICKSAGIEQFTSHAFRDTFATRFIEQRPHDYMILSEILGHKDVSITLNIYTHVMKDSKVMAMNDIMIKTV